MALVNPFADIVEVGVAYSDPGMDGPTIARPAPQECGVAQIRRAGANPVLHGVSCGRDLGQPAGGLELITPDRAFPVNRSWLAGLRSVQAGRIFPVAPSSTRNGWR